MNKLKLNLDQLTVESFNTDASEVARRGTVRAHSELCIPTYGPITCGDSCDTCDNTCYDSCGASCGGCSGGYACGGTCGSSCVNPTCNTCLTNCQQESCVEFCP